MCCDGGILPLLLLFVLFLFPLPWSSRPALVVVLPVVTCGTLAHSMPPPARPQHGLFMDMVDVCIIAGANGVEVKERK